MEETRTLPANYSYFYPMGTAAPSPGRAANASSTFYSSGCSVAQCKSLTMEKRCQMSCCINFCCLQVTRDEHICLDVGATKMFKNICDISQQGGGME